jgi:hypothetical protein
MFPPGRVVHPNGIGWIYEILLDTKHTSIPATSFYLVQLGTPDVPIREACPCAAAIFLLTPSNFSTRRIFKIYLVSAGLTGLLSKGK